MNEKNEEAPRAIATIRSINVDCLVCHEQTGTYNKFPTGAGNAVTEPTVFKEDGKTFTKGWYGKELVGLDEESTYRCMITVTRYMDRAAQYCVKTYGFCRDVRCVMGAYGGGNLPMKDQRLTDRYKTYNKLLGAPTALDDKVLQILGIPVQQLSAAAPIPLAQK